MKKTFIQNKRVRRFLIRFFLVFALVEVFLTIAPPLAFQMWLADALGSVLHIPTDGIFLFVNGIAFEISAFCTGLTTWGLWLGLLYGFSYPRGMDKLKYALLGLIGIIFVNYFRLLVIVYLGKVSSFAAVDGLHTLTWFIMSALVMGAWFVLLSVHLKTNDSKKIASFLLTEK